MRRTERFDSLIRYHAGYLWPDLDWRWIKAVIEVESAHNPLARSECGARGLMQVMPETFLEVSAKNKGKVLGGVADPDSNLVAGILYLRDQWVHLAEIPETDDRMAAALASYNCGRGYINCALRNARERNHPRWWAWTVVALFLSQPDCTVSGRNPDHRQAIAYVDKVRTAYRLLRRPRWWEGLWHAT